MNPVRKLKSVYYTHVANKKGSPKRIDETLLFGEPIIRETLNVNGKNLSFNISPQSFFQPNTIQAQKLFEIVIKAAALDGQQILYDLYCGAGTIGLCCSPFAKYVYGIEINASALANARAAAQNNDIPNITFIEGDTAKVISSIPEKADTVIVDPPRSGLHLDVVEFMSKMKPARIVYVSCNPTTLARDTALFTKTGYTLESVQPVDMFPQTYHIENVALLVL